MSYHSLFDEGPCDVHYSIFGEVGFFAAMTKGSSQNYHSPGLGYNFVIAVAADGTISLSSTDAVISGSTQYNIWAVPSVSVVGRTGQLANVAMGGNYGRRYGFSDQATGGTYAAFTTAQPATPNPMSVGAPVAAGMSISAL